MSRVYTYPIDEDAVQSLLYKGVKFYTSDLNSMYGLVNIEVGNIFTHRQRYIKRDLRWILVVVRSDSTIKHVGIVLIVPEDIDNVVYIRHYGIYYDAQNHLSHVVLDGYPVFTLNTPLVSVESVLAYLDKLRTILTQ